MVWFCAGASTHIRDQAGAVTVMFDVELLNVPATVLKA
jgi:hypothetical protein